MTQAGAKKWAKEIQAFAEGKTIQMFYREWQNIDDPSFDCVGQYRIKPEPHIIPFDFTDAEKLIGKVVKDETSIRCITGVYKDGVSLDGIFITFSDFLECYVFLGGSSCGKEVQE